jgi:hypothetical protein
MPVSIEFERHELRRLKPKYEIIRHCLNQEVKDKGDLYLPRPNADDRSDLNSKRYDAYLSRAVFYEVTTRTLGGLVGQIYSNDPEIKLPAVLDAVVKDASGNNLSLVQSSKETVRRIISYGRAGLYVDYPITNGAVSKAQQESGEIKPTINIYSAESIINWRSRRRGAKHVYSLIVLIEFEDYEVNDFEIERRQYYKALKLAPDTVVDGVVVKGTYFIEIYKQDTTVKGYLDTPTEILYPQDHEGNPLTEIPFTFVGAENNDEIPDSPPLYPLAVLNVGHYRNSADYEESVFIIGQPTLVITGLDTEWWEQTLQKKIALGSRGGIPLPKDADAKLLQVEPNVMAKEAMEHKEKQMVAIGAKLVEQKEVEQTATQANINNTSETSVLADIAKNVSAAYVWALETCLLFVGNSTEKVVFALNTEFAINRMTSGERAQLIQEWAKGAITFSEMRKGLRESGVAVLEDEEAKAELEQDVEAKAQQAADAAGLLTKATAENSAPPSE